MKTTPNNRNCYTGKIADSGLTIDIDAPAKINLFLKVTGKRPDGYHNIFSWFQALDLADSIKITKIPGNDIKIKTNHPDVPEDESNLVCKAIRLMQDRFSLDSGFQINLEKNIPVAAGLGGGSSDAASAIKGLNRLFNLGLSSQKMSKIGQKIGSDVPFFFSSGQAEVSGRGEIVKNIVLPTDYWVLLVTPRFAIRASEAYERLKLDLTEPLDNCNFTCCRKASELFEVISDVANDLERALRSAHPLLGEINDKLANTRAGVVRLSGSGPTVFALFDNDALLEKEFASSFVGKGLDWRFANPVILPH
ncbi:MAG: 4-(cytidine 5'-diphospho)-2-C-methyl-D-erythritol kinase [candidate division Zixibacteria bacterium]|nr:4-(cytidine 5'-diphospho)-2-C-methyl-D-erythritol kinase [candidate division Zixibacteria bacterium]